MSMETKKFMMLQKEVLEILDSDQMYSLKGGNTDKEEINSRSTCTVKNNGKDCIVVNNAETCVLINDSAASCSLINSSSTCNDIKEPKP